MGHEGVIFLAGKHGQWGRFSSRVAQGLRQVRPVPGGVFL
jgi:hypothetical protein